MGKKKNKSLKNANESLMILVAALLIILIIIGSALAKKNNEESEAKDIDEANDTKQKDIENKELAAEKVRLDQALNEVTTKINDLEPIKAELVRRESLFFRKVRFVIGTVLLLANVHYIHFALDDYILYGRLIDFNGIILLSYTFLAFVAAGNSKNFIKLCNDIAYRQMRKSKKNYMVDLQDLYSKRKNIQQDLDQLNK